eukprot:1222272-Amphidinium_carterae.1
MGIAHILKSIAHYCELKRLYGEVLERGKSQQRCFPTSGIFSSWESFPNPPEVQRVATCASSC